MEKFKKKLSGEDQSARMSVLKDIMSEMDGLMSEDLDGKKKMKVSVSADSKNGLEKGLNKAEDVLNTSKHGIIYPKFGSDQAPGSMMDEESLSDDSSAEPDEDDFSSLSSDEIDSKIKELLALKEQKSVKAPF